MSASINISAATKKYEYIAPTPPSNLIDATTFTIDFAARKFLSIGVDPANSFNVVVHILTPSRHVSISADFMRKIFSFMGNILSFILDKPVKYKRVIFLETDSYRVSSMVYQGESVLVLEDNNNTGCRVLLNRTDLLSIQYLEWAMFEQLVRKSSFTRPTVMQQFDEMCEYFKNNFKRAENVEEMAITIKNVHDDLISSHIPKNSWNYVSQIKLFATTQLAEQCIMKIEPETNNGLIMAQSPESFARIDGRAVDQNDGPTYFDRRSRESNNISIPLPSYSPMSPPSYSPISPPMSPPPARERAIDRIINDVFR